MPLMSEDRDAENGRTPTTVCLMGMLVIVTLGARLGPGRHWVAGSPSTTPANAALEATAEVALEAAREAGTSVVAPTVTSPPAPPSPEATEQIVSPAPPTPTATPIPFAEGPFAYGTSYNGNELLAYRLGTGPSARALIGGIHGGYEWNTTSLVSETLSHLQQNPDLIPSDVTLYVVPCGNPDGAAAGTTVASTGTAWI